MATPFLELLRAWYEGDASPEQLAEFEALLRSDPRFRREVTQLILLDVHLYRRYAASGTARPRRKWRVWEAVAAALIVSLSAVAVVQLLLKTADSGYPVVGGELASGARTIKEGTLFEVRGAAPATVQLKDGSRIRLEPGSAGTVRAGAFELARGSGTFFVGQAFRVVTPSGFAWSTGAEFSAALRSLEGESRPELTVAVSTGVVDVEAWGVRDIVRAGEDRGFGPPPPTGAPDYYAMLKGAKLTPIEAIDRAVELAPGVPIKAVLEEEQGKIVYSVDIAVDRKVRELSFDVRTGEKVEDDTEEEDKSALAAAIQVPLKAWIEKSLGENPGRLVEAEFERKGGKPRAEIKIFRGGKVRTLKFEADRP